MATTSNTAGVKSIKAIRAIMKDRFVAEEFKWKLRPDKKGSDQGTIRVADDQHWPNVYTKEYWISSGLGGGLPKNILYVELERIMSPPGEAHFIILLREISVHLESPLTILALSNDEDSHDCWSEMWIVQPGSGEVQNLKLAIE